MAESDRKAFVAWLTDWIGAGGVFDFAHSYGLSWCGAHSDPEEWHFFEPGISASRRLSFLTSYVLRFSS